MKKLILLALLFLFAFTATSKEKEPPKWIYNIGNMNDDDNIKYSVGIGDGSTAALMNGLVQLCELIKVDVKITNTIGEQFVKNTSEYNIPNCNIGKVEIQKMQKTYYEEFGRGDTARINEMYSRSIKINYINGDEKILIKEFIEEVSEIFNHHYEMTSSNCSISDVIIELKTQGVSIEDNYIDDEMNYYLLLKAKVKNIKSE